MSRLRSIAQSIRHLPGLEQTEGLWRILRGPYQKLLNAGGHGVSVRVGGKAKVCMPAEFAGGSWEATEPEAVEFFERWVRTHPGGLVLDIGSSIGIFSAIALFADPATEVVAFDPDLPSLAAVRRMCQFATGSRLKLVHCFVSDDVSREEQISDCSASTEAALRQMIDGGDPRNTRYFALGDKAAASVPIYTLDRLLGNKMTSERPLLIKCDVEGAELNVLRGAKTLIRQRKPNMIISVHPPALKQYGFCKEDIEVFLRNLSYKHLVIAVDHEEHWWCEFKEQG